MLGDERGVASVLCGRGSDLAGIPRRSARLWSMPNLKKLKELWPYTYGEVYDHSVYFRTVDDPETRNLAAKEIERRDAETARALEEVNARRLL
jgi:hypothetical protein